MATTNENITERELREAFKRSGLWRCGWNFHRAITTALVAWSLRNNAIASRRSAEKNGKPVPMQQALI